MSDWNNPELWKGVTIGACHKCGEGHVLRNGLCWTCERKTPEREIKAALARQRALTADLFYAISEPIERK